MRSFFEDVIVIGLLILVLLVGLVVLALGIAIPIVNVNGVNCEAARTARGVEGHYGGWKDDTCYVTTEDGRTLTLDQYDVKRHEVSLNG